MVNDEELSTIHKSTIDLIDQIRSTNSIGNKFVNRWVINLQKIVSDINSIEVQQV